MEDFRPDAQTALMGNLFAKKQYREVIDIFRRSTVKADGDKEANRLMIAAPRLHAAEAAQRGAAAFPRRREAGEARDGPRLPGRPTTGCCAFSKSKAAMCRTRWTPFSSSIAKSRPEDPRIHTALMMKAETLFANKETAAAAKVYSEINASRRQ